MTVLHSQRPNVKRRVAQHGWNHHDDHFVHFWHLLTILWLLKHSGSFLFYLKTDIKINKLSRSQVTFYTLFLEKVCDSLTFCEELILVEKTDITVNRHILLYFTSPSVSAVSPLWPGPSSAAPRSCLACADACRARGCPCTAAGCACLCAASGHKTQSPEIWKRNRQEE